MRPKHKKIGFLELFAPSFAFITFHLRGAWLTLDPDPEILTNIFTSWQAFPGRDPCARAPAASGAAAPGERPCPGQPLPLPTPPPKALVGDSFRAGTRPPPNPSIQTPNGAPQARSLIGSSASLSPALFGLPPSTYRSPCRPCSLARSASLGVALEGRKESSGAEILRSAFVRTQWPASCLWPPGWPTLPRATELGLFLGPRLVL